MKPKLPTSVKRKPSSEDSKYLRNKQQCISNVYVPLHQLLSCCYIMADDADVKQTVYMFLMSFQIQRLIFKFFEALCT